MSKPANSFNIPEEKVKEMSENMRNAAQKCFGSGLHPEFLQNSTPRRERGKSELIPANILALREAFKNPQVFKLPDLE